MEKIEKQKAVAIGVSLLVVGGALLLGIISTLFEAPAARMAADAQSGDGNPAGTPSEQILTQDIMDQLEQQKVVAVSDIIVGSGAEATPGNVITVHYTGILPDGTKFDSSLDRGQPFQFVLGAGEVIRGWDAGVAGMKIGGKRQLVIPPSLGYGARAVGSIPPNSTLLFEVELLGVSAPSGQ